LNEKKLLSSTVSVCFLSPLARLVTSSKRITTRITRKKKKRKSTKRLRLRNRLKVRKRKEKVEGKVA